MGVSPIPSPADSVRTWQTWDCFASTRGLEYGQAPRLCTSCCCSLQRCRRCRERWRRRSPTSPGVCLRRCSVAPCRTRETQTEEEEESTLWLGNATLSYFHEMFSLTSGKDMSRWHGGDKEVRFTTSRWPNHTAISRRWATWRHLLQSPVRRNEDKETRFGSTLNFTFKLGGFSSFLSGHGRSCCHGNYQDGGS